MGEEVLVTEADGVLEVTINRPEQRNAMTRDAARAIGAAMDRLEARDDLRCAILTGAGGFFCAGMDLKGFLRGELPVDERGGFGGICTWTPRKPVIAAVDGPALAGGFELALACDLIVASAGARFGIPEVKRGLVAAGGGVVQLPRLLPRALAMELALTGDPISAARALELGLINRITQSSAIEAARELARAITGNGPLAVAASKAIIRDSWHWPADEITARQGPYIETIFSSEDAREGARAFAEKRAPRWQGR
ncbi:crotonase/enoyl-CoA hydratase family protein [Novosphingobium panipatense]|uniref:crotonase/enoyl-CoA hydratase family protein n=1 Tax=Novosphingobium TaxID=165696 RepID=UPI000CDB707C|nr:crotonase/enoyl-CoA hydratase family protein [Novosphingobium sp. HII-3]